MPDEPAAAVADAHRREWALVLAATVRVTRDLDLAEECVQEAYLRALGSWRVDGVPRNPAAWLTTVARRRALDVLRRDALFRKAMPQLVVEEVEDAADVAEPAEPADAFPDDRLRLVFTCCHPALSLEAQVALTLRLVCGLSTAEVARGFLVGEATMAARITRAKKKIAGARIPYRIPAPAELPERVAAVLAVVYLIFTTGHAAPAGDRLVRNDLVGIAIGLARMLRALLPADAAVTGLLALLLLTDARRGARLGPSGELLLLAEQDRARWDRAAIAEGVALAQEALRARPVSRYAVEAAIAAVHDEAASWEETDWAEIVALYGVLLRLAPSPVVALNRAVAVGFADGPAAGLAELDALGAEPRLAGYGYLAAARADMLRRLGRVDDARIAYQEALLLTENAVERTFLAGRLAALPS
jgi:RNA polymerase sigma-70 factor (ECF subfamily)